jgi:hypothetical protein
MGDEVVPVLCLLETGKGHLGSWDVLFVSDVWGCGWGGVIGIGVMMAERNANCGSREVYRGGLLDEIIVIDGSHADLF